MVSNVSLQLSRDQIVDLMERIAQQRRGTSAEELLRAYRDGSLEEPGEVIDFLSLADLLEDDDPLHGV